MIPEFIICFLFRIVLPISLLAACLVRYNGLSLIYLICLLIIPLVPSPQRLYYKGAIRLQTLLLLTSTVFVIAQAVFQIVLLSYGPYGHFIKLCTTSGNIAHQIGFDRLDDSKVIDVIRLVIPDVCVFISSLVAFLLSRGFHKRYSEEERAAVNKKSNSFIEEYISVISVLLLLLSGIVQPNVLSSVYFLSYIAFSICWAFHISSTNSGLHFFVKTILTIYSALHLLLIYLYQLEFFQSVLVPNSFSPRLLGLPSIIKNSNCSLSRELLIDTSMPWPFYIQPLVLFILYWILALEIRLKYNKNSKLEFKSRWSMCFSNPQTTSLLYNNPMHSLYGTIEEPCKQPDDTSHSTFKSIMFFFMRQSYVASLIIMMTWSITYHSWLTFVLLLWACISWITPFSHWFCMASSPYLVLYSDVLLIIQYIYGMNLSNELPTKEGSFELSELGFQIRQYPVLHIGIQTLFAVVFLITLRQHISDKKMIQINNDSMASGIVLSSLAKPIMDVIRRRVNMSGSMESVGSNHAAEFINFIKSVFTKYWILVCCTAFLVVALQNKVSLFQILYMVIFLIGFIIYKFSLRAWKIILRPLWWFMVIYSIVLLLIIYTYQFENMPQNWSKTTNFNDQWLLDIGLRTLEKPTLFIELLIPTLFSMAIVVQLHFFHTPLVKNINHILNNRKFLKNSHNKNSLIAAPIASCSTEASTCAGTSMQTNNLDEFIANVDKNPKFIQWYDSFTSTLWLIAELHMPKVVCFVAMVVAIQQVSAINAVFIIMIGLSMPSKILQNIISFIMIVWSSLVVLLYMVYQLEFVKENILERNCTNSSLPVLSQVRHFSSNAWWLGLHKSSSVSLDVRGYLFIVLIIVLEKVVRHHQELHRYQRGLSLSCPGVIFPEITRKMADETITNCIKYLCNNCFTYFGFEINLMTIAICMSIRGDAVAVIHSLWLLVFLNMRRKHSAKLWPIYTWFLSTFLVVQYLLILGWPPGLCKGYPWDVFTSRKIVHWLYLTDTSNPQNQYLLLADFFQLFMACCQRNVFCKECAPRKENLGPSQDLCDSYIPADFMSNKTWIDFVKILVLDQFLWFTLSIIYITAQTTISLFNSGFLVGCFFFLWHGQGLYLRPRKTMRRWWLTLIFYNFFVILSKVWLQLASCVYIDWIYQQKNCFLVQLFNLYCLRSNDYQLADNKTKCIFESSNSMTMDCVCFIVIIIQYRIFKCSYFKYVIKEHKKRSEMAHRGAQLVQDRLEVHLNQSKQRDEQMMDSIKNKVSKLKQRLAKLNPKAREPLSHYEAIYSGDYYLFEDSDSESEIIVKNEEGFEEDLLQCSSIASESSAMASGIKEVDLSMDQDDELNASNLLAEKIESISVHEEPNDSNIVSGSSKEDTSSFKKSFVNGLTYIKEFLESGINSVKKILDDSSNDYRSIAAQLSLEMNNHASMISTKKSLNEEKLTKIEESSSSSQNEDESWSLLENDRVFSDQVDDSYNNGFMMSFYYALLANSNLLCYTLMIVNHMYYASVLSMPLPFFVFLWGMLSTPRPSKRFWIVVITYVQLVIIVKYIFQFQFPTLRNINDCGYSKSPLCLPRIIGIEISSYSTVCDLLLLLGLFFHRFALKGHGLWREKTFKDDEDFTPRHKDGNSESQHIVSSLLDNSTDSENVKKIQDERSFINRTLIYQKPSLLKSVHDFVKRMDDPETGAGGVDVYSWIFCTQFMVFIVILSSWSAFSSSNQDSKSNFTKIFEENVVPKTFLYMLLTQFLLMIFDRFLYIRKYAFVKFIYLAVLVFLFHIFLFVIVPGINQGRFVENIPAIFLYIFQCMYFGLSAYQVRCGYPTRILVNFLTKNYTVTSAILFQGIQAIPFLLELRSVLDWVCTKTTLNLNHWLKMEDIYANTFILKCWRNSEKNYPHQRGLHYWTSSKWLIGGLLVALLIAVIWFPLLFMSFINSAYISNPPSEATFTLTLGGYQPLFKVTTQQQFLQTLSQDDINKIKQNRSDNPEWDSTKVDHGFEDYKLTGNILSVEVLSNSSSIWTISPPSRAFLINDLKSNSSISLRFQYVFNRESNITQVTLVQSTVSWVRVISLPPGDPIRQSIAEVIKSGKGEIKIPRLFATFVQVPARGPAKPVDWLGDGSYVDCTIVLRNGSIPDFDGYAAQVEWWEIVQDKPKPIFSHSTGNLEMIVLNDFVPPLHLSFFANTGIIGLYVGFVWLIGKFVRLFFTSISYRIMFDEVPNVDRILKLCLEIYMVRESKELKLEEDLFAKLMFLYRSPETLIKWTKYKRQ